MIEPLDQHCPDMLEHIGGQIFSQARPARNAVDEPLITGDQRFLGRRVSTATGKHQRLVGRLHTRSLSINCEPLMSDYATAPDLSTCI